MNHAPVQARTWRRFACAGIWRVRAAACYRHPCPTSRLSPSPRTPKERRRDLGHPFAAPSAHHPVAAA
eukprot:5308002-Alexandrium_andersonii.AAC.1